MKQPDPECVHVLCHNRAVVALSDGKMRAPWLACEGHAPSMRSALAVGNGAAGAVSETSVADLFE